MPWKKQGSGYTKASAPSGQGGHIKNPEQYEALRREGKSKESAARITNSQPERSGGRRRK